MSIPLWAKCPLRQGSLLKRGAKMAKKRCARPKLYKQWSFRTTSTKNRLKMDRIACIINSKNKQRRKEGKYEE